tara:strand:- start:11215 stop:12228 length:1014 start_codon:yes stop_codon:yes gene_type:complete
MNVLVTGGCGFIGSNLVRELVRLGHNVEVVDDMSSGKIDSLSGLDLRVVFADLAQEFFDHLDSEVEKFPDVAIIQGDFSHPAVLQRIESGKYNVVFHQAAIPRVLYSVENPIQTTDVNLSRTLLLFNACKGSVDRVVYASSSSVYGGADILPTPEDYLKSPKSPYAWQKSCIEDLSKIFFNLYGLDIVCLRYFNVFGPGQLGDSPYSTAVSAWCNAIKDGRSLRSDGNGEQTRDMCYVDNVVSANILAATVDREEGFKGECYNIACGERNSNNQILNYLLERFPNIKIENAAERIGDVKHTQANIEKARVDIGYEPLISFWEGLEKTINWWRLNDSL